MAFKVQRYARGLQQLLQLAGGEGPTRVADEIQPQLDMLEMLGLTQRTVLNASAAGQTTGGQVIMTPSSQNWSILHAMHGSADANAGLTNMVISLGVIRDISGASVLVATRELNPVIAQNFTFRVVWQPPRPWLLPPGSQLFLVLGLLTGLPNTAISVTAEVGMLG